MKLNIKLAIVITLVTLQIASAQNNYSPGVFNVKAYGAVGDGKNLDSKAINKAIDAAANVGGGTVLIPAGNYLSGSIHLKSNISLLIDQGATIIAAPVTKENDYDDEEAGKNTIYQD